MLVKSNLAGGSFSSVICSSCYLAWISALREWMSRPFPDAIRFIIRFWLQNQTFTVTGFIPTFEEISTISALLGSVFCSKVRIKNCSVSFEKEVRRLRFLHIRKPLTHSCFFCSIQASLLPSGQDVWIQIKRWTMDHKKNAHWCERARYPHPPSDLTGQRHCLESCLELEIPVQMLTAELLVGPPREGGQEKQLKWCTRWPPK